MLGTRIQKSRNQIGYIWHSRDARFCAGIGSYELATPRRAFSLGPAVVSGPRPAEMLRDVDAAQQVR